MGYRQPTNLLERVERAAETLLKREGSVGPLELLVEMALLERAHVESWRRGLMPHLEPMIQAGPDKLRKAFEYFGAWVAARALKPVEAGYQRADTQGLAVLQVTASGEAAREKFFSQRYVRGDLPPKQTERMVKKLTKAPDLVVIETVSPSVTCGECGEDLAKGRRLVMEQGKPLCLACADLDHLEFLPSGDAALSRRAKKYSPLCAVVVRFSRARKRYERQGILASAEAIARAEAECCADADERAARRKLDASRRQQDDRELVAAMARAIAAKYPGCPTPEAQAIAQHAATRGSGRVGRSAAGRELAAEAIELAVIAHVRHAHTRYDELLMAGRERREARASIRERIDEVLTRWSATTAAAPES